MSVVDQYDFWRRRLAGEVIPIHDGEPQAGFYRVRTRDKTSWRAVAYWFKDSAVRCRVGGDDIEEQRAMELWPYASKHPITHEVYQAVTGGGAWPDLHEAVTADRINSAGAVDEDSFDGLQDRIKDLARDAEKLIAAGGAKSQDEADRASDLANRLGELHKKADTARAAEKKPHDDAAKAVQAKWLPVISTAEIFKVLKAAVITPFLVAQDKKRKAIEDAARQAAAEAAKTGEPAPAPPPAASVKAGSGGRRSVALRTVKVVAIADRAAVLAFFADNQMISDVLQQLAEKATRAGVNVPGVTVTEEQRAA
jgi:hypothetical protein